MLKIMEWWICLAFKPAEVESLKRFRKITGEEESLLLSTKGASGQYKEGVVFSENMQMLIRNIPPPLALALAQTDADEKKARQELMSEFGISELEAVYMIADTISLARTGQGV